MFYAWIVRIMLDPGTAVYRNSSNAQVLIAASTRLVMNAPLAESRDDLVSNRSESGIRGVIIVTDRANP